MKPSHPSVYFNKNFGYFNLHKHLDGKLSYEHHLKSVSNKVKKTLGFLPKFWQSLPRQSLIAVYKSFIRSHLDYFGIWYCL